MPLGVKGCLWSHPPSDDERFIYMGDDNKDVIKVVGTFRLLLKISFHLILVETYVALSIRWNIISISIFNKFDYSCLYENNKVSFSLLFKCCWL